MTKASIRSGIYAGEVVHQRFAPRPHRLSYSIFQVLLDLDRIDDDLKSLRSFSHNRFNLFGFYDRDHGPDQADTGRPLQDRLSAMLAAKGLYAPGDRIFLLTMPSYCSPNLCTKADANRAGTATAMANGHGGHIQGLELTASLPGEVVTPWLDGFGVIVSGAFNQSSLNPSGTSAYDVPGLSKKVINTTVYYEKYGFSARISNRYRGDFLGEVPDYTNSLQDQWVHSESIYDAQVSYTFQEGPLKGVSLSFSGSNLNNEPFWVYQGKGHPEQILRYEKYGATYLFGVNYRY